MPDIYRSLWPHVEQDIVLELDYGPHDHWGVVDDIQDIISTNLLLEVDRTAWRRTECPSSNLHGHLVPQRGALESSTSKIA